MLAGLFHSFVVFTWMLIVVGGKPLQNQLTACRVVRLCISQPTQLGCQVMINSSRLSNLIYPINRVLSSIGLVLLVSNGFH